MKKELLSRLHKKSKLIYILINIGVAVRRSEGARFGCSSCAAGVPSKFVRGNLFSRGMRAGLWLIIGTRCLSFSQILTAPATEFIAEEIFKAASRAALHKLRPTLIA
jgi:hypothetical protein